MLIPVPMESRGALRPLFEGFPGLHGVVDSVVEGWLGEAFADDPAHPRVARLVLDFNLIGGDPDAPAALDAIAALTTGEHVAVPKPWVQRLVSARGPDLVPYERFSFAAPRRWDRARLRQLRESLPAGLLLERITTRSVAAFNALADSLTYNFRSPDDFVARGVGFGVRPVNDPATYIAGCSSFAISSRSLEFEIQTHPDYQRRGLALVTGARMVEYCIENGLDPCWDAAHEGSARLAERLGFVEGHRYTAYRLA